MEVAGMYDLLIKNGTIIDGTGKPRLAGDIAISGEVIKDIGVLNGARAEKTIDAAGKFVTPGFIDITNHSDSNGSLFENPGQEASLTQGVTTILVGNCGVSLAPIASHEAIQSFAKWQDISAININWARINEYCDELERHPLGINIATLIGHNTARRGIIGNIPRPLSREETVRLQYLIEQGMYDGAFGISTSLGNAHEQVASTDELISILRVLRKTGGIYKTHLRNESRDLLASVNEAIRIGRETQSPVVISHMKATGRKSWPLFEKSLEMIANAEREGIRISSDISPYARTGSFLYMMLPGWAREGGFTSMFTKFRDQETRARILKYLSPETFHFDRITIASTEHTDINGKTIEEIAKGRGERPEEVMLDIILASRGKATIFGKTLSFRNVLAGVSRPFMMVASDGGGVSRSFIRSGKLTHPRSFGAFPHFLHYFVQEKKTLSWEEGIRKITGMPAEKIGFKSRGKLEKRAYADIVILNPTEIRDRATYQNPFVPSVGIDCVMVNGRIAAEQGSATAESAGKVLRRT